MDCNVIPRFIITVSYSSLPHKPQVLKS